MAFFMGNNGKGTQANKLESDAIIEKYFSAYDGNKTNWALFVFKQTGLRSPSAWRKVLERYLTMNPDKVIEIDTGHDLLPNVWDGNWMDLARKLHRQRSDISVHTWKERINVARENGTLRHKVRDEYVIEHLSAPNQTAEELWGEMEKASKQSIMEHAGMRWADIKMTGEGPYIGIAFASDQHIGNKFCDHERLREDATLVRDTDNLFIIHAGDYIDNFLPVDKPRAAMKQDLPPGQQWKMAKHYIDMHGDKLLAVVAGNHDLWTADFTDIDPLGQHCKENGILYHKNELNIRLWVRNQPYHISVRHKRRGNSQLHPAQVVKKMWQDGEADFDIGVVGHNHVPTVAPFTRHCLERWAIRPGAYKVIDGYAESLGFASERPTCPMVIISPYERQIQGFSDLRSGIRTLKALNGEFDKDDCDLEE
tara:strand:- start:3692 stop:4960 length:1269 start_codon:yes stop_codon:yes gene_type:complete